MSDSGVAGRSRLLGHFVALIAVLVLFVALDMLRLLGGEPLLDRWIRLETHYYFVLLGALLPLVYLLLPRLLVLDLLLALVVAGSCGYFFAHAEAIVDQGWEFGAPPLATWMASALWIALLEAVRRAGGWALFVITLCFSLLPLVADRLPGALAGLAAPWGETAAYHVLSIESIFGLPFRAFAELVIGFVLFGLALQHTGVGRFFLDLAFGLLGHVRGGPAKVAILSSGLMGSMSGSVVTNVLTTGQLTIPAMKRSGMRAEVAGGVEACASTGGVLLPPIMGSTAFVMATFLEVPYYQVALAAAVPSLLYFGGLFLQVDAHAAATGLAGIPREQLPSVWRTLKSGWFYLGAFVALVVMLVVLQREAVAPYFATALLLALNQFSSEHRWNLSALVAFLQATGRLLAELVAVLAGVGLIVGALSMTGLSGTLVNDLLYFAGDSVWLLLLMGALTSFVLGIGMTVTAAYIFLAIVLAPALVQGGLDAMAVHLFILYWAMLSFITPPVALGAFAAASIAQSNPLRTGIAAMRLGSVIYFIPFMFVLDPALILHDSVAALLASAVTAVFGIVMLVAGIQGYVPWLGKDWDRASRLLLGVGGLLVALPPLVPALAAGGGHAQALLGFATVLLVLIPRALRRLRQVPG
ncbi:MAG: TRAP transporter fused permease subunit [Pseudomonadales bacterium]